MVGLKHQPWPVPVTPLPGVNAGSIIWRQHGNVFLTIVAKASFELLPRGVMHLSKPQPLVSPRNSAWHDLAPYHQEVDVWLSGHVRLAAPPSDEVARLTLYRNRELLIDKRAKVVADGAGFGSLTAFGPVEPAVPSAASVELLEVPPSSAADAFQNAPADQRVATLMGDEWFDLSMANGAHNSVSAQLPRAQAQARVYTKVALGFHKELALFPSALTIDVDARRCSLTWRGHMPIEYKSLAATHVVVGVHLPGHNLCWQDPFMQAAPPPSATSSSWRHHSHHRQSPASTPRPVRPSSSGASFSGASYPGASYPGASYPGASYSGASYSGANAPHSTARRAPLAPQPSIAPSPMAAYAEAAKRTRPSPAVQRPVARHNAPAQFAAAPPLTSQRRAAPSPIHSPQAAPSRPAPSRPAPSRPEPSRPEPSRAEPSRPGPSRAGLPHPSAAARPPTPPSPPLPPPSVPVPTKRSGSDMSRAVPIHAIANAPSMPTRQRQMTQPNACISELEDRLAKGETALPFSGKADAPEPIFNDIHEAFSGTCNLTHDAWASLATRTVVPFSDGSPESVDKPRERDIAEMSDGQHFLAAAAALGESDR